MRYVAIMLLLGACASAPVETRVNFWYMVSVHEDANSKKFCGRQSCNEQGDLCTARADAQDRRPLNERRATTCGPALVCARFGSTSKFHTRNPVDTSWGYCVPRAQVSSKFHEANPFKALTEGS